ncbi:MAG: hypothetical protein QGI21_03260 [Candidatus Poseidoniaceae archaeon]|jgi:M6 family metalloprotease-like protein|nr:hypothetical protein [Candidatus Poseidoniaceae archaeon]
MKAFVAYPIALMLAMISITAFINSESIDDWFREHAIIIEEDGGGDLLPIQEKERWLVVLIDFSDQKEPAGCDQNHASNLLDQGASNHLKQSFGDHIELLVDYHDQIITPAHGISSYGTDVNGERDSGIDGNNPHTLSVEIAEAVKNNVDWSNYDLDGDGWVDRFLLLHCVKPQEDNGASNSIWSHFASTDETVELPDGLKLGHYTISSHKSSNNLGTIIHEMYHQLGGIDLYPVSDETVQNSWKGVGKWDIMSSGNWNGDGAWPALPTSPMIELLGGDRHLDVELDWIGTGNCIGPDVDLIGMSEGGKALKIKLDSSEYVWVELRTSHGFDSHLPGEGVLVLKQDHSVGGVEDNIANSHPDRAWLKVIEADGEQNLVSGTNDGEASDLFGDGDSFGSSGDIIIRNRDGFRVDWTGTVSITNGTYSVAFESEGCGHDTTFDLPDHGSILTGDSNIPFSGNCEGFNMSLTSSDGREISREGDELKFSSPGVSGVLGIITGTINCATGSEFDLEHKFEIMGNIPIESTFDATVPVNMKSDLIIPIEFRGDGQQIWYVGVDGPLDRIATTQQQKSFSPGDSVILNIDPAGLLTPGMRANGEVILASDSGHRYVINVELIAENEKLDGFDEWTNPGTLVPLAILLAAIWVVLGVNSPTRKVSPEHQEIPTFSEYGDDPTFVDSFGESY